MEDSRSTRLQINRPATAIWAATPVVCLVAAGRENALNDSSQKKYPLLEALLECRHLSLQPMYRSRDVAALFEVCVRVIQNRITSGHLKARNLPGRWRFFPQDLEDFLRTSQKGEC